MFPRAQQSAYSPSSGKKRSNIKQRLSHKTPLPLDVPQDNYSPGVVYYPHLTVQGSGLGWSSCDRQFSNFTAQFVYDFVPPEDGVYVVTSYLGIWGNVWGHANDQWWNSKDFHLQIGCTLASDQPANYDSYTEQFFNNYPYGSLQNVLVESNHVNYTLPYSPIDFPEQLQHQVVLEGGVPAAIECIVDANAYAQGAGAYCGMDLGVGVLVMSAELARPSRGF